MKITGNSKLLKCENELKLTKFIQEKLTKPTTRRSKSSCNVNQNLNKTKIEQNKFYEFKHENKSFGSCFTPKIQNKINSNRNKNGTMDLSQKTISNFLSIKLKNESSNFMNCFSVIDNKKNNLDDYSNNKFYSPLNKKQQNSNKCFIKLNNFQMDSTRKNKFKTPEINKNKKTLKKMKKSCFNSWKITPTSKSIKILPGNEVSRKSPNLLKNIFENFENSLNGINENNSDYNWDFDDDLVSIDSENLSTDDDNCFSDFDSTSLDTLRRNIQSPVELNKVETSEVGLQNFKSTSPNFLLKNGNNTNSGLNYFTKLFIGNMNSKIPNNKNENNASAIQNWKPSLYSKVVSYQNTFFQNLPSKNQAPVYMQSMNHFFDKSESASLSNEEGCQVDKEDVCNSPLFSVNSDNVQEN